jgi:hypothetical protein
MMQCPLIEPATVTAVALPPTLAGLQARTPQESFDTTSPDPDRWPRDYMFNGFNDASDEAGTWLSDPRAGERDDFAMNRDNIPQPSATLIFGERRQGQGGYYVDILAGNPDDLDDIDDSRHGNADGVEGFGYSNYAAADTSVRAIRFPDYYDPISLWAVTKNYRNNTAW